MKDFIPLRNSEIKNLLTDNNINGLLRKAWKTLNEGKF